MTQYRPYSDFPLNAEPLLQNLAEQRHDVLATAILPPGPTALQLDYEIEVSQFTDFAWADFVFSDLSNPTEVRGCICKKKLSLRWHDQVILAIAGEAVL